jgi:hypothetical protein
MAETRRLHHQALASPSLQREIIRERNEKLWLVSQCRPSFAVLWSSVLHWWKDDWVHIYCPKFCADDCFHYL